MKLIQRLRQTIIALDIDQRLNFVDNTTYIEAVHEAIALIKEMPLLPHETPRAGEAPQQRGSQ